MRYASDHAGALADLAEAGASVTFTASASTYDAAAGAVTTTESTVAGQAIRLPGDRKRYDALGLKETDAITLLFAPTTYGASVSLGAAFTFGSQSWTVRAVDPLALDGTTLLSTVVGAK